MSRGSSYVLAVVFKLLTDSRGYEVDFRGQPLAIAELQSSVTELIPGSSLPLWPQDP